MANDYSIDFGDLIWVGVFIVLAIWGLWELIDWLFIDEKIIVDKLIVPELKLVVNDNIIDTLYIYKKP